MSKRLSKEELESDPLIENYNRIADYVSTHQTQIIAAAVAVIVIVGGIIGYSYYAGAQEQKAQQLLSIAEDEYAKADYENALYGNEEKLTYGFDQISEDYPRTNAGNIARYYAAVSSFELGDVDNALLYIKDFDVPDGILGVGALSFKGKLYLAKENYEEAAKTFLKAAKWDENKVTTPDNLFEAAQAYYKEGNFDKAKELANKVIEEYPQSSQINETQRLKGMIAVK
jgi:TolA-binding protein